VVFARPPLPGTAKTRLIPLLGPQGAADFQAALLQDTLRKVLSLQAAVSPYLYLSGPLHSAPALPAGFTALRQRGPDLGARLEHAFRFLLARHSGAVVMGTDSPLLLPRILRQGLDELRVCDAVLGPCPDGGYYLIALRRFLPGLLRGIRWGTPLAFRDTLRRLLVQDFSCALLEPCEDVDRPADLRRLAKRLSSHLPARRLAPSVWRFLKSSPGWV